MSTSEAARLAFDRGPGNILLRACVDCGLRTGSFCDFCLAQDRMPGEVWAPGQPTPSAHTATTNSVPATFVGEYIGPSRPSGEPDCPPPDPPRYCAGKEPVPGRVEGGGCTGARYTRPGP